MSEIGIIAGGYQRVRDYAESVDRLLLELKQGGRPPHEVVQPVLALFEDREEGQAVSLPIRLVRLLIASRRAIPTGHFPQIAAELRSGNPSPGTVRDLEHLATALDDERAAIAARLQGS